MSEKKKAVQEQIKEIASHGIASTRKSNVNITSNSVFEANQTLLKKIQTEIPASNINGFASLVNYIPTSAQRIHRWFRYREGYSIELVKDLIKDLPKGSLILDPFCGAGTTLLAAKELGLPSVGFDVNPISVLVSRVKTRTLSDELKRQLNSQIKILQNLDLNAPADSKPALKIIDKVFDQEILNALLIFRKEIKKVQDINIREFLFVGWLSILEGVSNVYKEGNGLKYRNRKRTEDGYISLDIEKWKSAVFPANKFLFVKDRLLDQLTLMIDDLQYMSSKIEKINVIEDSAENVKDHLQPNSVDMTIFSPPYCNCFNYFKMYKLELWMGEFVSSYEELKKLNRRGLRSHVETVLSKDDDDDEPISEEFALLLDGLKLWDNRIPKAVRGYFIDMRKVLSNLFEVTKPGGKTVMVVGNSAYGGVILPTDAILAKISEQIGFKFEKLAVARSLSTSSQQQSLLNDRKDYLRESIVILSKEDPRLKDFELTSIDELPTEKHELVNKVFAISNSGLTHLTHKFHRYPGKFIPHVPRWALSIQKKRKPNLTILDPFCGSGTTLVEAMKNGVNSYGIDVDPIARLVTKSKTTIINGEYLRNVVKTVNNEVLRSKQASFRPNLQTLSHWFTNEAINDLGMIRDVIERYRSEPDIYNFLLVCYAAVIRRTSNADNQTQKTYVSHTRSKIPEDAKPLFLSTLKEYSHRLELFANISDHGKATILDVNDARDFANFWKQQNLPLVDSIITSPPYLNSVDYVYNQMAEYFWIGDLFNLENQPLQNIHKTKYIGTEKVKASSYQNILTTSINEIDEYTSRVFAKNKKNAYVVAKYFNDMTIHFQNAYEVLSEGGSYYCVVGDSVVSGESIPAHELLIKCAEKAGFTFDYKFGYEIRNRHMRFPRMGRGGIVRYDWILTLNK